MSAQASTIPGWESLGYRFEAHDEAGGDHPRYGFRVTSPSGQDLGSVADDVPEAAVAAACALAAADTAA